MKTKNNVGSFWHRTKPPSNMAVQGIQPRTYIATFTQCDSFSCIFNTFLVNSILLNLSLKSHDFSMQQLMTPVPGVQGYIQRGSNNSRQQFGLTSNFARGEFVPYPNTKTHFIETFAPFYTLVYLLVLWWVEIMQITW